MNIHKRGADYSQRVCAHRVLNDVERWNNSRESGAQRFIVQTYILPLQILISEPIAEQHFAQTC